jgi:UDP-GlcNAc:undecaprenyl-phosphate GlcNAc-1-phosphate transferase
MSKTIPPYILYPLVFIVAVVISVYAVRKVIFITRKRKLYDIPDNIRKIHGDQIPSFGGIGIFTGYLITAAWFLSTEWYAVIISSLVLFFTGIYDDLMNMRPVKKLIAQLLASLISIAFLFMLSPVLFDGGDEGISTMALWSYIGIATVACTFFINAFNFIDGIDGLACTLAVLYSLVLAGLFMAINATGIACIMFSLAGATAGLLYFNRPPAKIYMGDTGSMVLGFTLFVFSLIFFCMYDWASIFTPIAEVVHSREGAAIILISLLFIPAYDAVRVFVVRLSKGGSPLRADRSHLHYYLLDAGLSHAQSVMVILSANVSLIVCGYFLQDVGIEIAISVLTLLTTGLVLFIYRLRRKVKSGERRAESAERRA